MHISWLAPFSAVCASVFLTAAGCDSSPSDPATESGSDADVTTDTSPETTPDTSSPGAPFTPIGPVTGVDLAAAADAPDGLVRLGGSWPVAIYRTPAGSEQHIGSATLELSGTNDKTLHLTLRTAGGTVLADLDASEGLVTLVNMYGGFVGAPKRFQFFINAGTTPDLHFNVLVEQSGLITGSLGGLGEYAFRNSVEVVGASVPAVFGAIAGTWQGTMQENLCNPKPPVVVTITSDGAVTNAGKGSLDCQQDFTIATTWDGNDDFIAPRDGGGFDLVLDDFRGGGSAPHGRILLALSALEGDVAVTYVNSTLNGSFGNVQSNDLTNAP